jgi:hypothetical protein
MLRQSATKIPGEPIFTKITGSTAKSDPLSAEQNGAPFSRSKTAPIQAKLETGAPADPWKPDHISCLIFYLAIST